MKHILIFCISILYSIASLAYECPRPGERKFNGNSSWNCLIFGGECNITDTFQGAVFRKTSDKGAKVFCIYKGANPRDAIVSKQTYNLDDIENKTLKKEWRYKKYNEGRMPLCMSQSTSKCKLPAW